MAVIKTNNINQLAHSMADALIDPVENYFFGDSSDEGDDGSVGEYLSDLANEFSNPVDDSFDREGDGGTWTSKYTFSKTSLTLTEELKDGPRDLAVDTEKEVSTFTGKATADNSDFIATGFNNTWSETETEDVPGGLEKNSYSGNASVTFDPYSIATPPQYMTLRTLSDSEKGAWSEESLRGTGAGSGSWTTNLKGEVKFDVNNGFQSALIKSLGTNETESYKWSGFGNDDENYVAAQSSFIDRSETWSRNLSLTDADGVAIGLDSQGGITLSSAGGVDKISFSEKTSGTHSSNDSASTDKWTTEDAYTGTLSAAALAGLGSFANTGNIDAFVQAIFAGDDTITMSGTGSEAGGYVDAGAGNDTVNGSGGEDDIDGGVGNDTLKGMADNDELYGGVGDDVLDGGSGHDQLAGGEGKDTLNGGNGSDTLSGDNGDDTLLGGLGTDSLYGGSGSDKLDGGAGSDYLSGDEGNDTLLGGVGHDRLDGGAGDDTIDGGAGNDVIAGEAGKDILTGGAGRDVFVLDNSGTNVIDEIKDFKVKEDTLNIFGDYGSVDPSYFAYLPLLDKSDIGKLDTKSDYAALLNSANAAFASSDKDVLIGMVGKDSFVFADSDANGTADTVVKLVGVAATDDLMVFGHWNDMPV